MSVPASPNPDDDLDWGQTSRGMREGLLAFGRYRLLRLLGRGPTGAVWLAQDESLQVSVALKFLADDVLGDPGALDKLRRETRHRLALTHPHIVRIFNLEEASDTIAVVMEYVEGINLGVLHAAKPARVFEFAEVSAWLQQLCGTLSYAHEQANFIHGNLKPSNILLTHKSEIKLADFGAGPSDGESISGTLAYMSPQQLMGHPPVVTDDVYALGATLYELLTSKPPFYTGSIERQIQRVIPPSVALRRTELGITGRDEVPAMWEQAIAACLDKDPEKRPQTVKELWQRLNWEPEPARPQAVPVPADNQPALSPYRAPISPPHSRVSHFKPLAVAITLCLGAALAWWFGLEAPMRAKAAYQTKKQSDSEAAQKSKTERLFEEVGMQSAEQTEAARAAKEKADADQQARQIAAQAEANLKDLSKAFANPKIGDTSVVDLGTGVKMTLCYCPPGSFMMGSPASEAGQVQVRISKGYWLAKTECTQAQWRAVMGTEPSNFKGDDLPVERVSWKDAQDFMAWLNDRKLSPAGWKWSLPTEAQWEYACRAGTTQTFVGELELMAWNNENSAGATHPVGKKAANRWGLQDMHGNVSEWCSDFRGEKLPGGTDPVGALYDSLGLYGDTSHVIRGSTFSHKSSNGLAGYVYRSSMSTHIRTNGTGFRAAVVPETVSEAVKTNQATKLVPELVKKLGGTYHRESTYYSESGGDKINFVRTNLTTADLLQIGTAKHLKDFNWNVGTGLTDQGMAAFAGMSNLESLLLWNVGSITDAGLKNLEECQKLETLNIGANGGGITGTGFESLSYCESLRSLTLNYLVNVEGRNLRFLSKLKSLENLRLSMCKGITDADVDWISQMPKLEKLHLGNTSVTDVGLLKLAGMSSLKELTVTQPLVTPAGVNALTKALPGLVVLLEGSDGNTTTQAGKMNKPTSSNGGTTKAVGTRVVDLGSGVKMTLCYIPPGNFIMGSPASEAHRSGNEGQVSVQISKGYWLAQTECTQAQWRAVMGTQPSNFNGDDLPVERVSFHDAEAFMTRLNGRKILQAGWKWSLPTEAQWEYACRAGTTTPYAGDLEQIAWYNDNSKSATHPVGSKAMNGWGLYDMQGNVSEWCSDRYGDRYGDKLLGGTDPVGAFPGFNRVIRGGGWNGDANVARCAQRILIKEHYEGDGIGFRAAAVPETVSELVKMQSAEQAEAARAAKEKVDAEEKVRQNDAALVDTTKTTPFSNSLGMKFVPVKITGGPTDGKSVLFSIWDTRVKDYAAYAKAKNWDTQLKDPAAYAKAKNITPVPQLFAQTEAHPVANASWEDAKAFCAWLTKSEHAAGKLTAGWAYRLPSDHEWSCAIGIGDQEDASATPDQKDGKIEGYPWNNNTMDLPPPQGFANYDSRLAIDNFENTSPVGSFPADRNGLYDMSGNVRQWCEDWYDTSQSYRVLRGASWIDHKEQILRSSYRDHEDPRTRYAIYGFRVVLVAAGALNLTPTQDPIAPVKPPQVEATDTRVVDYTNSLTMKFQHVPGTTVLFCIHETRKSDYAKYVAENGLVDGSWRNVMAQDLIVGTTDDHPVTNVSREDASAFCLWLSKREGQNYRLPTDEEWSYASGIGRNEMKSALPAVLDSRIFDEFPWGKTWPPTKGAGNYADTFFQGKLPGQGAIADYTDGYETTAPVMSFRPNKLGLYDLGGNVWEWCSDWFNSEAIEGVRRGGSWREYERTRLLTSKRLRPRPNIRLDDLGFRCVVEIRAGLKWRVKPVKNMGE